MRRSQRILLRPIEDQEQLFFGSAGAYRFVWNWALAICQRHYRIYGLREKYRRPSEITLRNHWNRIKWVKFKWHEKYSKFIAEEAIKNLEVAYQRAFSDFLKAKKSGKKAKLALPKRKKKFHTVPSFCVCPGTYHSLTIKADYVLIPRIGLVKMVNDLRWPAGKQCYGMVKFTAGRWWLTISYDLPDPPKLASGRPPAGIDVGSTIFATVASQGAIIEEPKPPKPYAKTKRRLKRLQRNRDRFPKGSKRSEKKKLRIAKLHERCKNIRDNFLHNLTSKLTKRYGRICLETLNVQGMSQGWMKSVGDLGWYEFRRQITYKSETTGTEVWLADRFYPSSKTCSCCGHVKEKLPLKEREFICENCGFVCDRDHNAALNLEKLPTSSGKVTRVETGGSLKKRKLWRGAGQRNANTIKASAASSAVV